MAAFGLHSMIGITDPCTGIARSLTEASLPRWFFPVAGVCLALVALANFSGQPELVLGAQAYIVAFHSGGVYTHLRVKHHPVAGSAPFLFVFIAVVVAALRTELWIALLGTVVSAAFGVLLGMVLVRPKQLGPDESEICDAFVRNPYNRPLLSCSNPSGKEHFNSEKAKIDSYSE